MSTTDTDAPAAPSPDLLRHITDRHSAPALTTPAPTEAQLRMILRAAASVPDHGRLRPYRLVVIAGEARRRFGSALREAAIEADADAVTVAKAARKPMFGPLQVAIIASPRPHPTVPEWEQVVTAGLTGYAMELAAAALGVGAAWRSGRHLHGEPVRQLFSLGPDERLLGWVNLGTTAASEKPPKQETDPPRDAETTRLAADPLISVAELAERMDDPTVRVCDVRWYLGDAERAPREYAEAHLPGAIRIDLDRDLSDVHASGALGRHPLPDAGVFAARLAALGIGTDDVVVAYDDGSGVPASRLWWMLDALGHPSVRLLDGGIAAWRAAGLPVRGDPEPPRPAATLALSDTWPRTIDRTTLRERLGSVLLLDVRTGERYRGEVEPVDAKPGHIPTAHNAPNAGNVGPDGLLRKPDMLAERFVDLGADTATVVVSCGSGVTACHTALAMRVAGLPDPMLYDGSYSDWVTAGLPVVTGAEPGEPV